MLKPDEALVSAPEFQNAEDALIPDPLTYSDWFQRADAQKRKVAVGVRRYATMKDAIGQHPSWEHFVDEDTGGLLTLNQIQDETQAQRAERVQRVRAVIAQRGMARQQVARLGFVPGAHRAAGMLS